MDEKKCCGVVQNYFCGCCNGAGSGELEYMQLYADKQSGITEGRKIYFNAKSFGDLVFTENGTVLLKPGVYQTFLNFAISTATDSSDASVDFYDFFYKLMWVINRPENWLTFWSKKLQKATSNYLTGAHTRVLKQRKINENSHYHTLANQLPLPTDQGVGNSNLLAYVQKAS